MGCASCDGRQNAGARMWEKSGAGKEFDGACKGENLEVWVGREKFGVGKRQDLEGTRQAEKRKPDRMLPRPHSAADTARPRLAIPHPPPADRAASQPPPTSRHHLARRRPDLQSQIPPSS